MDHNRRTIGCSDIAYGASGHAAVAPTPGRDEQRFPRPTESSGSAPAPELAVLSSRASEDSGFRRIEGQVENISGRRMEHVEAVVAWYTAADRFVTSQASLIERAPLMPGEVSPFIVLTGMNPGMRRYTISFRHFLGGAIPCGGKRQGETRDGPARQHGSSAQRWVRSLVSRIVGM